MKLFGKLDIFIILILCFLVFFFADAKKDADRAEIFVSGKLEHIVDLTRDATYDIDGHMVVEVGGGKIRALESDCPDQLCVEEGWIAFSGIPIVCVPNEIMIVIPEGPDELDAISR